MPGEGGFGLAAVMAALRDLVERTSIRTVAAELGMSPSGLHVLLQGSKPRAATRRKLLDWYTELRSRAAGKRVGIAAEDVEAAVAMLERYILADGRKAVRQRRVREIAVRLFGEGHDDTSSFRR